MKILVTGHHGFIGSVLTPMLVEAGHDVVGLDVFLFRGCEFFPQDVVVPALDRDVRDVDVHELEGFDAVVHLAAISNDPIGNLNAETTYDINHRATVSLAAKAKEAGVGRFVFASSCSLYGAAANDVPLDESAAFNPVTPYGESKVLAERDLSLLADEHFSPVYMRNATAFGVSPNLRGDLVVNDLVAAAYTTGNVRMLSDGTPWRPLVHVRDISAAALAALQAPRDVVHDQAFNVGRNDQNFRIAEIADAVVKAVPGSAITYAEGAGPDARSYRVNFDKIARELPEFEPAWTLERGIGELLDAYKANRLNIESFSRFQRILHIKQLLGDGTVDDTLRRNCVSR